MTSHANTAGQAPRQAQPGRDLLMTRSLVAGMGVGVALLAIGIVPLLVRSQVRELYIDFGVELPAFASMLLDVPGIAFPIAAVVFAAVLIASARFVYGGLSLLSSAFFALMGLAAGLVINLGLLLPMLRLVESLAQG